MVTRPDGAVALVTGGSGGIGAAVCRALAEDGWAVAVGFRSRRAPAQSVVDAIVASGQAAVAVGGNIVTDAAAMLEEASELGPVLAVVNNAGITADDLAISLSDEAWDDVIATNLTASFRMTRAALRPMIKARYGRVISIASVVGPRANVGQANYAASKAGLIGMTKTVAAEVARRGVTVNAVAPGFIDTAMTADLDLPAEALTRIPARRAGTPEEVAAAVRFLAGDSASYITGTTVFVDGGMSA